MGLDNLPGWSYSAERAWYEPPEYDAPTPPENDISVKQLIKIMNERNKKHMNLYEISSDYAKFIEAFDNGDIPEEAFADTLDGIHGMFEDKCVAVACSIKNDDAMLNALKAEKVSMEKRIAALEKTRNSKAGYLMRSMESVGVERLKNDPRAQISIKKNPPKVVFSDKAAFLYQAVAENWSKYLTVPKPELNTNAVKEDLKNGAILPGVHLEQGKRVDIS